MRVINSKNMEEIIKIPDEYMNIKYLLKNNLIHKINGEYSIEIKLKKNNTCNSDPEVSNYYSQLIDSNNEILNIINGNAQVVGESLLLDDSVLLSVIWIYQYYFNLEVIIFLPKIMNKHFYDSLMEFNESFDSEYELNTLNILDSNLEQLEQLIPKKNQKIIFAYSHITFNELFNTNKRRLNTVLGNILKKSQLNIFTPVILNNLELKSLENIHSYYLKSRPELNFTNLLESVTSCEFSNLSELIELVESGISDDKRIYLSLDLSNSKLIKIENYLNSKNITTSRIDSVEHSVVINSSKTTLASRLINNYDYYIMILPANMEYLQIVNYFGSILNNRQKPEIFISDSNYSHLQELLINKKKTRLSVNESEEYQDYQKMMKKLGDIPVIQANDYYYRFNSNQVIREMVLSNLKKKDYDTIRHYVKVLLETKYSITVKTCQLSTPCSPKDRSAKLNSLSNKISSYDYRCDVTCEIFKDYSLGVIVWGETFSNRGVLNYSELRNETFVFQTTNGNWKYCKIC